MFRKISTNLRRFDRNEKGNIAMIFALMVVPIVGVVGISVDYGRALSARTKMQAALDAAVITAAQEFAASGNATQAIDVAKAHYAEAAEDGALGQITSDTGGFNGNEVAMIAEADMKTYFLPAFRALANYTGTANAAPTDGGDTSGGGAFDTIHLKVTSRAAMAGKDLELSLMLDVTGSMSNDIQDLRDAGKDMVDIILNSSTRPRKMAIVPFAHAVNVGEEYFQTMTGLPLTETREVCRWYGSWWSGWRRVCEREQVTRSPCVVARGGTHHYGDAAPGAGAYFGSYDDVRHTSNHSTIAGGYQCNPTDASIIPLTLDRNRLDAAMDGLQAAGATSGHIGTQIAWQMLSPDWRSVWPVESDPAEYDDDTVMKVAVLMTDGQNNTWYNAGGSSDNQMQQLCEEMKKEEHGITVYTIGFDMHASGPINLLKDCASSEDHYFFPYDGEAMREVFRTIAGRIADGANGITLAD